MALERNKIGLVLLGVGDLTGGGGAERHFADFFNYYDQTKGERLFNLYFITDKSSLRFLEEIGKNFNPQNLILLPSFSLFPLRIRYIFWYLMVCFTARKYHITLLHFAVTSFYSLLSVVIRNLFFRNHIYISLNINDATLAHRYLQGTSKEAAGRTGSVISLLNTIAFDGIFVWYELLKATIKTHSKAQKKTFIKSARYCFANNMYKPGINKQKQIIFAARLVEVKDPLLFLESIKILKEDYADDIQEWRFFIYGKGELENEIEGKILRYGLQNILSLHYSSSLHEVFAKSTVFVSMQDYENFTSLSMLEAMACGNIIVAKNVGQTNYFVEEHKNGFLLSENSPKALSQLLLKIINMPDLEQKEMQNHSIWLANEVHTIENFSKDIELYWSDLFEVINNKKI